MVVWAGRSVLILVDGRASIGLLNRPNAHGQSFMLAWAGQALMLIDSVATWLSRP